MTLTTLDDDGEQVTVGFTDGDTRAYDLVIGADGLRSQVREMVFGPDVQPNYTGQVCWRYNLPRIEGLDHIWVYIGATGTAGLRPARAGPDVHADDREAAAGRAAPAPGRRPGREDARAAGAVRRAGRRAQAS